MPYYFNYINVACAALATAAWLARPSLGPWPLLVALAPWAFRWWREGRPSTRTAFDGPLLVFFLTAIISVWAAYDRQAAMAKFWLLIGSALLFYAFTNWQIDGGRRAYREQAWILSGLGALTAAYFLISNDWEAFPAKVPAIKAIGTALQGPLPDFSGERVHPNVIGGILAALAPFGGAAGLMAWHEKGRWPRVAAGALLGMTLIGLLLTMTRGAWLALGAAGILAVWWPLSGLIERKSRRRRNLYFAVPVAAVLGSMLVLSVWPQGAAALLQSIPASETGGDRATLYTNVLNLLDDYLFTGAGLGGFMMLYSSYALLAHVGFITHSHNLFFDVIIEQGIVALVALAWMWLLMFEGLWRMLSVRRTSKARRRRHGQNTGDDGPAGKAREKSERTLRYWQVMLSAGMMSLVVVLTQGVIDDPIYGSRAVVVLFIPLSFGAPLLKVTERSSRRWQLRTVAAAAALIVVVGVIWWRPLLSRLNSNLAAVAQSRTELSIYEWPEWPIQDAVRREVDLSEAVVGYERALRLDEDNSSANRRLGQIELSLGEYEAALGHLQDAYTSTPWDNATRQLLGEAYITTGDVATGMTLWRSVDNGVSQLDLRRFWYEQLGEDPPLGYVRQTAMGQSGE
ncbi:MAG: O-antigen ligase family protein [Chloroflexota bacterium]|jgi:hypothetical protein